MKIYRTIAGLTRIFIGSLIFVLGMNSLIFCQVNGLSGKTQSPAGDFQTIDLGFMKMELPSDLIKVEKKCIEGGCWRFANAEMEVTVNRNTACWRPTFEREYPSYSEEIILIDGVTAKLWSFSRDGEYQFISGANYATESNNKIGLGIYLSARTNDSRELAKKVFSSVKFESVPKH